MTLRHFRTVSGILLHHSLMTSFTSLLLDMDARKNFKSAIHFYLRRISEDLDIKFGTKLTINFRGTRKDFYFGHA